MYRRNLVAALIGEYVFPTWELDILYNPDCVRTKYGYGYLSILDSFVTEESFLLTTEFNAGVEYDR